MSLSDALPQPKIVTFGDLSFTVTPIDFNDLVALEQVGVNVESALNFDGLSGARNLVFLAARKTEGYENITLLEAGRLINIKAKSEQLQAFLEELGAAINSSPAADSESKPETDDGAKKATKPQSKKTPTSDSSPG
jgi:hypothetical protein